MVFKQIKFNPIFYLPVLFVILAVLFLLNMNNQKDGKDLVSEIPEITPRPSLAINGSKILVDIADTPEKRTLGLSGRLSLAQDEGMFFILDSPGRFSFWMKDMNFPIDIIWIDAEFKVADITKNAIPESFPNTFEPRAPILYVLETVAGWADKNGIKIGDTVLFHK